jgi:hypothetical protein
MSPIKSRHRFPSWLLLLPLALALLACGGQLSIPVEPPVPANAPTLAPSLGGAPLPEATVVVRDEPARPTPSAAEQPAGEDRTSHAAAFCPEVPRPAMLISPSGGTGESYVLMSLDEQEWCEIALPGGALWGNIIARGDHLFYIVQEPSSSRLAVLQLDPNGTHRILDFTRAEGERPGPYAFTISEDGQKIAWAFSQADFSSDGWPIPYYTYLYVADLDGSNRVTLLEGKALPMESVVPIRFSPPNDTLYFGQIPDGIGGMWNSFTGRYNSMHRVATNGGEPVAILDCPALELFICIGDVAADGTVAYADDNDKAIYVVSAAGELLNTFIPPARDYVGQPRFSSAGTLAFVGAELANDGHGIVMSEQGHILLVPAPYTAEATTLLNEPGVAGIWGWADEESLVYSRADDSASWLGIVTLQGENLHLSHSPLVILK